MLIRLVATLAVCLGSNTNAQVTYLAEVMEGDPITVQGSMGFVERAIFFRPYGVRSDGLVFGYVDFDVEIGNAFGETGLFLLDREGRRDLVMREASEAPGLGPGTAVLNVRGLELTQSDKSLIKADVNMPGGSRLSPVYWTSNAEGEVQLRSRSGAPTPNGVFPGATVAQFLDEPRISDSGHFFMHARFAGSGLGLGDQMMWRISPSGDWELLLRRGDAIPPLPPGRRIHQMLYPKVNQRGDFVMQGVMTNPGIGADFPMLFGADANGPIYPRVNGAEPAQTGSAYQFSSIQYPSLSPSGSVIFFDSGVPSTNSSKIWIDPPHSEPILAIEQGQTTINDGSGLPVSAVITKNFVMNDRHQFGLVAVIGADLQQAVLVCDPVTGVSIVAEKNNPAPSLAEGFVFAEFSPSVAINESGQVAFYAKVSGPGLSQNSVARETLWATDRCGNLHLVAQRTGIVDVALGSDGEIAPRQINSIAYPLSPTPGNESTYPTLLDDGSVVWSTTLTDPVIQERLDALLFAKVSTPCPGDIANDFGTIGADGMVSFGDFLALLGVVGPCPGMTPGCTGDIADDFGTVGNEDGQVSFGDFLALLGLVGPCP